MEGFQAFIHSISPSLWFQDDVVESNSAIRTCLAALVQIASAAVISCYDPEHRSSEWTLHTPHIESEVTLPTNKTQFSSQWFLSQPHVSAAMSISNATSINKVWTDHYCGNYLHPLQTSSILTYSINVISYVVALLAIYDLYTDRWKMTTRRTLAVGISLAVLASIATTEALNIHSMLWLAFPLASFVMSVIAVINHMEKARWQRRPRNQDKRRGSKKELET